MSRLYPDSKLTQMVAEHDATLGVRPQSRELEMISGATVELSDADFDTCVASGTTLVCFRAPWCGPCRAQDEILDEVAEAIGGRATVAKLNVDENVIPSRLAIHAIPALLVFQDGQEVTRLFGTQQRELLLTLLEQHVAQP